MTEAKIDTRPIYFANEPYQEKQPDYKLPELQHLNKPKASLWKGFIPEEVGHEYQDLCQYIRHNESAVSGFAIFPDGTMKFYTREELDRDYDRDADNSSMVETNDYSHEQESRDMERYYESKYGREG